MYCRNCGKNNAENARFCRGCGSDLEMLTEKEPEPVPELLKEEEQAQKSEKVKKPRNAKKIKLAVILTVALALVISAIGIGSAAYLKLNSPLVKIGRGFKDLLTSGEAHKYKINVVDSAIDTTIECDFKSDLKNKSLEAVNIKTKSLHFGEALGETVDGYTLLHINEKEYISVSDNVGVQEGKYITYNGYTAVYYGDELNRCFPTLEPYGIVNAGQLANEENFSEGCFEIISELLDFANGKKEFGEVQAQIIKKIDDITTHNGLLNIDFAGIDLDIYDFEGIKVDGKIEKQIEKELKKCLTDEKWLEENLGLKVSKDGKTTVYKFDINIEKTVKALYDIYTPLLKDLYNQIKEKVGVDANYMDSFEDLTDGFMSLAEEFDESFLIWAEIQMSKNEIVKVDIDIKEKQYGDRGSKYYIGDKVKISVEISETDTFKLPDASEYSEYIDNLKGKNENFKKQLEECCSKNMKDIQMKAAQYKSVEAGAENDVLSSAAQLEGFLSMQGIECKCPDCFHSAYNNDYRILISENGNIEITCPIHNTTETVEIYRPKIDASNVKSIFQPLIYHYASLEQGIHSAIGIDYNKDYRDELLKTVCEQTDWTEMGIVSIYKFKTVKSASEVKEIYKRYISDDVVDKLFSGNSNFFSYNNELYRIQGAVGTFDYDASSITYKGEKDGGYIVAIDRFLGNGAYLETVSFLVKYEDGQFKIVKELGEEKLHSTDYYSPNYSSLLIFDW